jgi:tRNA nucleotidyltransferase (CCA-adding enzyme)
MVLDGGASLVTRERALRALVHDLGKARTPREKWPRHAGHEVASVRLVDELCDRLRIPNEFRDLAVLVARHHGGASRPSSGLDRSRAAGTHRCPRRPERFESFLLACEADARGRRA